MFVIYLRKSSVHVPETYLEHSLPFSGIKGAERNQRTINKCKTGVITRSTLKHTLKWRMENVWTYPRSMDGGLDHLRSCCVNDSTHLSTVF